MTKNAFLTGGAEGQGYLLAKKLARKGWRVFAGVLPGAKTDLGSEPGVTLVEQDVSKTDSVERSAAIVKQAIGDEGLHLVMNVAGVADTATGVIEGLSIEAAERMFQINTFGQLRVAHYFLPMMRQARPAARMMNFCSGAIVVNPPFAGAYNMSKHAIHGMTLTLRHELAGFGIQVTSILPGGVMTGMSVNSHERTKQSWAKQSPEVQQAYDPYIKRPITQVLPDLLESKGNSPEYVTDEIMKLVDLPKWKPLYLVGRDAKPLGPLRRWLSDSALESMVRKTYQIPAAKI